MNPFYALRPYISVTPEKAAAYVALKKALRRGELTKKPCEVCGIDEVHAHHPDYAKPVDVMWLCPFHHFEWHRYNGRGLNGGDVEPLREPGGVNLVGRQFGGLSVLGEVEERDVHGEIHWKVRCVCGNLGTRRTHTLLTKEREGRWQCCWDCLERRDIPRGQQWTQEWADYWRRGGGLYTERVEETMARDIRDAVSEELGVAPDAQIDPDVCLSTSFGYDWGAAATITRNDVDDFTLEELGQLEGVTRERIRQIEAKALEKLLPKVKRLFREGKPPAAVLMPKAMPVPRVKRRVQRPAAKVKAIAGRKSLARHCSACGKPGHYRQTCPNRLDYTPGYKCGFCGAKGHKRATCHLLTGNEAA